MAEEAGDQAQGAVESNAAAQALNVAPGPHVFGGFTTRRMMLDVLIGLTPVLAASIFVFRLYAVKQIAICVVSCLAFEAVLTAARRRPCSLGDFSAVVTGLVLAFSLPGTAPWYVGVIGSAAAIGIGKFIFGGLGQNIFNPAMLGRAFVMLAFTTALAAPGYRDENASLKVVTQATPMTAYQQENKVTALSDLFWGTTNGSVGETSAIACLIGGLYLCLRRTASWQIPAAVILAVAAIGGAIRLASPSPQWTVLHDLCGGALLLGAFFIATDPVTSPLTPWGKVIFGMGVGALVMIMRRLSSYPEGVMFSVLIMNAFTPLINRWTIPRPVGGRARVKT
jgi:electron transport complex protein RnfD